MATKLFKRKKVLALFPLIFSLGKAYQFTVTPHTVRTLWSVF
jgi:hypothetical protein